MQDLIHFLIKYWYFSLPFVVAIVLLFIEEARSKGMLSQLSSHRAIQMMNRDQASVIDIREKNLYKQGHIVGAINIPKKDLDVNTSKLENKKDKPIILVCANGQQSGSLASKLRKEGFKEVAALSGGMQSWQQDNLPIVK